VLLFPKASHTSSLLVNIVKYALERIKFRFKAYRYERKQDGRLIIGLALRAAVVHPKYGALAHEKDDVKNAAWADAETDALDLLELDQPDAANVRGGGGDGRH